MATLDKFETETNLLVTKIRDKMAKLSNSGQDIRDRDESNQREDPNVVACRGFTILNRCEAKQNIGEPKRGTAKALDAVPPQIRKGNRV
jgi:hypothetical protein